MLKMFLNSELIDPSGTSTLSTLGSILSQIIHVRIFRKEMAGVLYKHLRSLLKILVSK